MVKNLPSNTGDTGLTPSQGTKIPHTTVTKPVCCNEELECCNKDPVQPK